MRIECVVLGGWGEGWDAGVVEYGCEERERDRRAGLG